MTFLINPYRYATAAGGNFQTVTVSVVKSYTIAKTTELRVSVVKSYTIVKPV